jgi:spermidine synthase
MRGTGSKEHVDSPPRAPPNFRYSLALQRGAIAASRAAQGQLARVAVVGLGTGSLACHRQDGEAWTYFEIDPYVVRIARDPPLFRFLSACGPDMPIVLGDARLTLTASAPTSGKNARCSA